MHAPGKEYQQQRGMCSALEKSIESGYLANPVGFSQDISQPKKHQDLVISSQTRHLRLNIRH